VELDPQWHIPTADEVDFANELLAQFYEPAVAQLSRLRSEGEGGGHTTEQIVAMTRNALTTINTVCRLGPHVMHEADLPIDDEATEDAELVRTLKKQPSEQATLVFHSTASPVIKAQAPSPLPFDRTAGKARVPGAEAALWA
jgi:hypothetical protein